MNPAKLRSKRVILPTIAVLAVLGSAATVWTATASDDLQGSERDRVASAAGQAAGGTAVEVEASDDLGAAYEVEVRKDDGTEVDVTLDKDLNVVSQEADDHGDGSEADDDSEADGDSDADDRALGAAERASAEKAALDSVEGGTVVEVEASDDNGGGYEVEVRDAKNTEWEVDLDAGFTVLHKSVDD